MEIYTDKAQKKAVIVADEYELNKFHSAAFRACVYWHEKASKENEIGDADSDRRIGDSYGILSQQFLNAFNQLREKED